MMQMSNSSLGRAAVWVEATVQGPIMTAVAVLAIAAIGLAMLRGQLSVRRGATVVLGCFIAFGASSIARGLAGLAQAQAVEQTPVVQPFDIPPPPPPAFLPPESSPKADVDPYAGASVRS